MEAIVLFDADCMLCRNLAGFAARRASGKLAFQSWQSFKVSPSARLLLSAETLAQPCDKLRVLVGEDLLAGREAWAFLLEEHPALQALGWLATQLGLQDEVAGAFEYGGHALRRACPPCRRHRWA